MLVEKLYAWLAASPDTEADRILSEALEWAEPAYASRMLGLLLGRRTEAGWACLIARYDELPAELREKLVAERELLTAAISRALRSGQVRERCNALRVCEEVASPRLAYLLPNLLRDSSPTVRDAAVQVLHRIARTFLERTAPERHASGGAREAYEAEYEQMVRAINEAMASFELHLRVEVIEAATWFGRRLSDVIWERLEHQRWRARAVIENQLPLWNKPWMAAFLLSTLRQRDWRRYALRALRSWTDGEHVAALLREADLLEDPTIRAGVRSLRSPQLERALLRTAERGTAEIQAAACRWVASLGFSEAFKLDFLGPRLARENPIIRRAAMYALISLDVPQGVGLLQRRTSGDTIEAAFARWYLAGRRALIPNRIDDGFETPLPAEMSAVQIALWRECRRSPPHERWPLIEAIREDIGQWRSTLRAQLRSPDPRDRLLVVQTVGTPELLSDFHSELTRLKTDPVESIRHVVELLLSRVPQRAAAGEAGAAAGVEPSAPAATIEGSLRAMDAISAGMTAARRQLDEILAEIVNGSIDSDDAELMKRVAWLIHQAGLNAEEGSGPEGGGR